MHDTALTLIEYIVDTSTGVAIIGLFGGARDKDGA